LADEVYDAPGTANDYVHDYVYDLVGNRFSRTVDGTVTTYSFYNEADELEKESLNSDGSNPTIVYGYDDNGSLTSKTEGASTTNYTYNLQNRLASADDGTTVVGYSYDPSGIRVQKIVNSTNVTDYLIDPYNPTGYAQVFVESDGVADTAYIIGSDMIGQATGTANPDYFLYDGHGSVRQLVDSSGSLISGQQFDYDAYGNLIGSVTPQTDYLYVGEQWDSDLGGYNNRARYYLPLTGRFNRRDEHPGSQFSPVSLHKYLYGNCNPINNIDPAGQMSYQETLTVVGVMTFVAAIVQGPLHEGIQHRAEEAIADWNTDAISFLESGVNSQMQRDMREIDNPDVLGMTMQFYHELGNSQRIVTYSNQKLEERFLRAIDAGFHGVQAAAVVLPVAGAGAQAKIIWSKPHGTPAHWDTIAKNATKRAVRNDVKKIWTNRGLNKVTGQGPGYYKPNLRGDVITEFNSGKFSILEVRGEKQPPDVLVKKEKLYRQLLGDKLQRYDWINIGQEMP
jgi:RHS repeat-associated protein